MKILYALANYPQSSESYIDAEINYVRSRGVEVQVWSRVSGYGYLGDGLTVHRGSIQEAVASFKPDLIHVHYLVTASDVLPTIPGVPATVRAHSFDWSHSLVGRVASFPWVEAIYAFPHFAREVKNAFPKVVPMPVAYDASLYDNALCKPTVRDRVIRLAAGKRMKGIEDFLEVSKAVSPRGTFHLALSQVRGDEQYVFGIMERAAKYGVHARMNAPRAEAVEMIRTAGIYLDTSDPMGHPFGMPISVVEALASGLIVILRESPAARELVGETGAFYSSVGDAANLVEIALGLPDVSAEQIRKLSIERAKLYRSDVVLPRLIEDWKKFIS